VKTVYVVTSGCIYEGGGVYGVFLREDIANSKFDEMVAEERKGNIRMEEYILEQIKEFGHSLQESGEWLKETEEIEEDRKRIIFHGSQYIALTRYECVE